jgi:hypothetical protein
MRLTTFFVFLLLAGCGGSSSRSPFEDGLDEAGGAAGSGEDTPAAGKGGLGAGNSSAGAAGKAGMPGTGGASTAGTAGTSAGAGNGGSAVSAGTGGIAGDAGTAGEPQFPDIGADCEAEVPATSQTPRLTPEQYDRTVRDLLGVTSLGDGNGDPPSSLLPPNPTDGTLTAEDTAAYQAAAEAIAAAVVSDEARLANFLACAPATADDGCLRDTITSFGRRAFRRPLTADEEARFEAIVALGGSVEEMSESLLVAFLASPSFVLRPELGQTEDGAGNFLLTSYEVAARLSYMLWGTLPDPELDQAADADELTTSEAVLAQAVRMVQDDKTRDVVAAFHRYYTGVSSGLGRWQNVEKDPQLFPDFTDDARAALLEESELFFDSVVFGNRGGFRDLFTSSLGFVNSDTAPLYGLSPAAFPDELVAVNFDPAVRPGFLTRAGFLSAYSSYTRTSPILRGNFVSQQVLGVEVGAPPVGLDPVPPTGEYATNREYFEAFTAGPACAGCHASYINPPGFVLEAFDSAGRFQTAEAATGAPIDTVADVFIDDASVRVTAPADLMQRLSISRYAQTQYARKWLTYAYGREPSPLDLCAIVRLSEKLGQSGYAILDLLVDLTQTETFLVRRN